MIKLKLVNKTSTIVLVQAGMQPNQFASMIGLAGNINFTGDCTGESFFSFKTLNRFVVNVLCLS